MKRSSDRKNIVRDVSFFSGGTYVSQAMFFIRGFLNAKLLGPALYGIWSALNIILGYSSYAQMGALNAMNREIPYQNGRRSKQGMTKVRDVAFTVSLVMNFIFSFVLIIIGISLWKKIQLNEAIGFLTIGCLSLTFSIYEFYRTSLIAVKRFLLISKVNVAFSILSVLLTIALVPRMKIYGVYIVAVVIPMGSLLYLRFREPYRLKLDFDLKEAFRLIKIGLPLVSIDFLDSLITSIAGLMVLFLLGKVNMGYYAVAMLAARFLMYFPNSINRTFEPHIYQRYGETHDIGALEKYLFKPTLVMAFLFPVLCAFYYTGVAFFIRHFLSKYNASIYPFFVILLARFFVSFSPTSQVFLTAINKQKLLIPVYLGGIAIIATSFINMGFGIMGVAISLLVSCLFTGSVIFLYALNHYREDRLECIKYLFGLSLPLIYMALAVIFVELTVSSSLGLLSDSLRLVVKLGVLAILSTPLVFIANAKTGIVSDMLGFLKVKSVKKYANAALIFVIIGTFLCSDPAFAAHLRPTSIFNPIVKLDKEGNLVLTKDIETREKLTALLKAVKYKQPSNIKYKEAMVSLTKYCPVGCKDCMFSCPLPVSNPGKEDVLSRDGVEKVLNIIRDGHMEELTFSMNGEAWLEKEKCLYMIREAPVKTITLITSGYWANTPGNAEKALDDMEKAIIQNKQLERFTLTVSVDVFHIEKIPLKNIVNIIDVLSQGEFENITLILSGMRVTPEEGKEPIRKLLGLLPVRSEEDLNGFGLSLSNICLENGYSFRVRYNALAFYTSFNTDGFRYEEYPISELLDQRIYNMGLCGDDKEMEIDFAGNVFICPEVGAMPSGDVYKDSFRQIEEKEDNNPLVRALREEGVGYVLDIASEVEPDLIESANKYNNPYGIIRDIAENPGLLFYVIRRLIQEDIRAGLIDKDSLKGDGLLSKTKDELRMEYAESSKKPLPVINKEERKKLVVLTIVEDPILAHVINHYNLELSEDSYEFYVKSDKDVLKVIEDKRPDIIVTSTLSDSFDVRRILQKAQHLNPDLQIIMYRDVVSKGIDMDDYRRFKNFKLSDFYTAPGYLYFRDSYINDIRQAKRRLTDV